MALNFRKLKNSSSFKQKKTLISDKDRIPFETILKTDVSKNSFKPSEALTSLLKEPLNDVDKCIFFDTETTGLSGGAGNFIFLAGLGLFENNRFTVYQYFLNSPGEETSMLLKLKEYLNKDYSLVTYNGKSFDLPLLNSRFILNRIDEESPGQHIDLLHPCRFIWKNRLKNIKLSTIEECFLDIVRKDDIPGALVPEAYREYILGRNSERVKKIMSHNQQDIISLAVLLNKLSNYCLDCKDYEIAYALARRSFSDKNFEQCLKYLRKSLDLNNTIPLGIKKDIFWLASLCLKKTGEIEKSAEIWQKLKTQKAKLELAKYYEHVCKDYDNAVLCTEDLLLESDRYKNRVEIAKNTHRLKRLRNKLKND